VWPEVDQLIEQLPEAHRLVVLGLLAGEEGKDIAARLGVTPARVSQLKGEAIQQLRDKLRGRGHDVPD
jgi:DNA-directed RNA polymerase specialized sigma subunit